MSFVERLYEAFRDENIGWDAAKALGDIIDPDTILTKANHADVKVSFVDPDCPVCTHGYHLKDSLCPEVCQCGSSKTHNVSQRKQW